MTQTHSPFDLTGRVAVVTGGNGGIGRGIALGLARAGASVAVLARNQERNDQVLSELQTIGVPAMAMRLDVTKRNTFADVITQVEQDLGGIHILVNNAGIGIPSGGVLLESDEIWDNTIETNLTSVFGLSRLVAKSMAERKRGKIINIASMYSYFGSGLIPSYSAAKGGIVQLTKSMAVEMASHNIQVNAIAPGWVSTEMTAVIRDNPDFAAFNQMILDRTPANRWGESEEMAGTAVFLASSASDFVTGTTIPVDGGYSIA
jgi:2-dehydro-3-deoxy-D-gluconate 5-dehydrogenase